MNIPFFRLYKYFSEKNTTDWVTPLPKFLEAINNSICRVTGVKPSSVNHENWPALWKKLYGNSVKNVFKKPNLEEGDAVRITKPKQVFDKGYFPSRSDHIYRIEQTHALEPEFYDLKSDSGRKVEGRFYRPELVKTRLDEATTFRVEKVIRTRKRKGVKELLVKFIDYPETYWIKETDIVN